MLYSSEDWFFPFKQAVNFVELKLKTVWKIKYLFISFELFALGSMKVCLRGQPEVWTEFMNGTVSTKKQCYSDSQLQGTRRASCREHNWLTAPAVLPLDLWHSCQNYLCHSFLMQDFCNGQLLFKDSLVGVRLRSTLHLVAHCSLKPFLLTLSHSPSTGVKLTLPPLPVPLPSCSLLLVHMALWVLKFGMLVLTGTWSWTSASTMTIC